MYWLVPLISLVFVVQIIILKTGQQNFWQHLNGLLLHPFFIPALLLFTALSFANVLFEALKWKAALLPEIHNDTRNSIIQTVMAMAAGFITPFKSGAVLSRIVCNENQSRSFLIRAMIQMAAAQFTVTLFLGLFSLAAFLFAQMQGFAASAVLAISGAGIFFVIYCILGNKKFGYSKFSWMEISFRKDLLFLSLARYLIFSIQFFIILRWCGVGAATFQLFFLIGITYLVNTLIPTGILGKIGVRELSGILIIGETTGFVMETAVAAFVIWVFNQALPALIGSGFFIHRNLQ